MTTETLMSISISGGCLCGSVKYSAELESAQTMACYCKDCQKATGSPAATFVAVPQPVFELEGAPASYTKPGDSGKEVTRFFCGDCGSQLYSSVQVMPGVFFVKLGTLDDANALEPQVHIWTRSRASWCRLPEGAPAFDTNPAR